MNKNDLLYVTLMIIGFLFGGVLIIISAPQLWWLGMTTVFVAIVIAFWVLSTVLAKKKKK
jgi:CHASE2 domain-containing sensor protein